MTLFVIHCSLNKLVQQNHSFNCENKKILSANYKIFIILGVNSFKSFSTQLQKRAVYIYLRISQLANKLNGQI